MQSEFRSKQVKAEVLNLLKNATKQTLSIRLSQDAIRALSQELTDIKRKNPAMKKLTLAKYISALVERIASKGSGD